MREAAREYQKLAKAEPEDLATWQRAADLELRGGLLLEALSTTAALAQKLAAKGCRLAALHQFKRVMELAEALPPAASAQFRHLAVEMERIHAETAARRDALSAYADAMTAFEKGGDDADAAELAQKMIGISPDNPLFRARRAEALCRLDRIEEALPEFRVAAQALIALERPSDALRVLERILHFRADPADSLLAAELYVERGRPNDAARAVTKLQPCLTADPESLDALVLLARAFEGMGQPARAVQVRLECMRLARDLDETDFVRELERKLRQVAPDDPRVRSVLAAMTPVTSSAPELSYRNTFASVTEDDLEPIQDVIEETRSVSHGSVLEELSFEELAEEWVLPVVSKEARRALDDSQAFARLRLFPKAEDALRAAIDDDPVCAELREALRAVLRDTGDEEGFVYETLELVDLYLQRRFVERAKTLVVEVLAVSPSDPDALALAVSLGIEAEVQSHAS